MKKHWEDETESVYACVRPEEGGRVGGGERKKEKESVSEKGRHSKPN